MDWAHWTKHWPWLSPFLVALTGWLGRRRGLHPFRWLVRQVNLNREIETCWQDRDNERRSKEYAMHALREMAEAGSLVAKAAEAGRLTISETSSSGPGPSPRPSSTSPARPKSGRPDRPLI